MRSFIAIEIPENARQKAGQVIKELKKHSTNVKWVNPENLHITLKFLGEIKESQLENIAKSISQVASQFSCMELTLDSLGAFPKILRPQVIWLGIGGEKEKLTQLGLSMDSKIANLGFTPETRLFRPHLTIGRLKRGKKPSQRPDTSELSEALKNTAQFETLFEVNIINLMKSTLTPKGAIYETLFQATLK